MAKLLLLCALLAACSSVDFHTDAAKVAGQANVDYLSKHLQQLTALGPRRAGDSVAGTATVRYLEQALAALHIATTREVFSLTPNTQLQLQLEDGRSILLPEVFFNHNIRQTSVMHGVAENLGYGSQVKHFDLQKVKAAPVEQINLLATIPGTLHPERVFELSAHHDTVPGTVGADDNTTSVAVLLEVARLLQQQPPRCTVRLCFFAAEEIGLLGAKHHVQQMEESGQLHQLLGLLNLDAVGFYTNVEDSQSAPPGAPFFLSPPTTGNFLAVIGKSGSVDLAHLVEKNAAAHAPNLPIYSLARLGGMLPDTRRSDHAPYWDAKIPAVFLTDTGEFRSQHYHHPSDTLKTLDLANLRKVTALVLASVLAATEQAAAELDGR